MPGVHWWSLLVAVLLLVGGCGPAESPAPAPVAQSPTPEVQNVPTPSDSIDPASGLVMDEHWELVRAHCSVCHSIRLVTQNRADRDTWLAWIRWMQDSQGLWEFDPVTEAGILDYLATHYAPVAVGRRPPLDPALLPPNPWAE